MKSTLVLINSVIDTPNKPLSYSYTRSVFSREERFEQIKNSIQSVKTYIPQSKICLVECSLLTQDEENYFKSNTDYFINIYQDLDKRNSIYSIYKAEGESIQTLSAIEFILQNNLTFDFFVKLSGRYYINNEFSVDKYLTDLKFSFNLNQYGTSSTILYVMPFSYLQLYKDHLKSNLIHVNHLAFESIYTNFIKKYVDFQDKSSYHHLVGAEGLIAVDKVFIKLD